MLISVVAVVKNLASSTLCIGAGQAAASDVAKKTLPIVSNDPQTSCFLSLWRRTLRLEQKATYFQ